MKKIIIIFIIIFIFSLFSFPQNKSDSIKASEKIEKKLASMNIKNYKIKENFSKMITKFYSFNENNMNGGLALTKLDDYNVDIYILILNQKDYFIIKYIEVIDENSLSNKEQMKQLADLIKTMNDQQIDKVSDAISGATQYTKKIYIKVKVVAAQIIKELEQKK